MMSNYLKRKIKSLGYDKIYKIDSNSLFSIIKETSQMIDLSKVNPSNLMGEDDILIHNVCGETILFCKNDAMITFRLTASYEYSLKEIPISYLNC